jgi:hypothetical protein
MFKSQMFVIAFLGVGVAAGLSGCGAGVPFYGVQQRGELYMPKSSICAAGSLTDQCVAKDLRACAAFVIAANPGHDLAEYQFLSRSFWGVAGGTGGYASAGVAGKALAQSVKIVTGYLGGADAGDIGPEEVREAQDALSTCIQSKGNVGGYDGVLTGNVPAGQARQFIPPADDAKPQE